MSDANTPKPPSLGKFKPLTSDTSLARTCAAALPGKCTVEQIAEKARLRPDHVAHRLRYGLGVAHGIGYQKAENGVITLIPPEGVPAEALVLKAAKASRPGKAAKAEKQPPHPKEPRLPRGAGVFAARVSARRSALCAESDRPTVRPRHRQRRDAGQADRAAGAPLSSRHAAQPRCRPGRAALDRLPDRINPPRCPSLKLFLRIAHTAQSRPLERGVGCLDADQTGAVLRSPAALPLSHDTPRSSRQARLPALAHPLTISPAGR